MFGEDALPSLLFQARSMGRHFALLHWLPAQPAIQCLITSTAQSWRFETCVGDLYSVGPTLVIRPEGGCKQSARVSVLYVRLNKAVKKCCGWFGGCGVEVDAGVDPAGIAS